MKIYYLMILISLSLFSNEANYCNMGEPHKIDIWYQQELNKVHNSDTNAIEFTYSAISIKDEYLKKCDTELNKSYQTALNALDKNRKEQLHISQRAWLKNFNTKVKISENINKGSGQIGILEVLFTKIQLTKDRNCQLFKYAQM